MIDVEETLMRLRDIRRSFHLEPDAIPFTALHNDIMRQVKEDLNRLYAEGKICVHETLNDKSITIKKYGREKRTKGE